METVIPASASIEKKIQSHLYIIRSAIVAETRPISIFLTGSFGRGEGSFESNDQGVRPIKDYDVLLVFRRRHSQANIQDLESRVQQLVTPGPDKTNNAGFKVTLQQTTPLRLRLFRDIATWEIKTGSQLLFGEDFRRSIRMTENEIPLSNGLRLLFKKSLGLVLKFDPRMLTNGDVHTEQLMDLNYECNKTLVEVGTAVALLGQTYAPSYRKRLHLLTESANPVLHELELSRPGISSRITEATVRKLTSLDWTPDPRTMVAEWTTARDDVIAALGIYLGHFPGIENGRWEDRHEAYYRYLVRHYYDGLARGIVAGLLGSSPNRLVAAVSWAYRSLYTLDYFWRAREIGHTDGEWPKETPILRVYTTAPLLALAISGRGVDEQYLEATFRAISNVYPIPSRLPTNLQGWSVAKDALRAVHEGWHGIG